MSFQDLKTVALPCDEKEHRENPVCKTGFPVMDRGVDGRLLARPCDDQADGNGVSVVVRRGAHHHRGARASRDSENQHLPTRRRCR